MYWPIVYQLIGLKVYWPIGVLADWLRSGSKCWGLRQGFRNKWRVGEQTMTTGLLSVTGHNN